MRRSPADRSIYSRTAASIAGIGATPSPSIFPFDKTEYFGRRAGVRYERSFDATNFGATPAASKIIRAKSNQEMAVPPPIWNTPEHPRSTKSHVLPANAGAYVGDATKSSTTEIGFPEPAKRNIVSTKLPRAVLIPPGPNTPHVRTIKGASKYA